MFNFSLRADARLELHVITTVTVSFYEIIMSSRHHSDAI